MTLINLSVIKELKYLKEQYFVNLTIEKERNEIFKKIYLLLQENNFNVTLEDVINLFHIVNSRILFNSRKIYEINVLSTPILFSVYAPINSNPNTTLEITTKIILEKSLSYFNEKLEKLTKLEEKINKFLKLNERIFKNENIDVIVSVEFFTSNSVEFFLENVKSWMLCKYRYHRNLTNGCIVVFQGVTVKINRTKLNGLYEFENVYLEDVIAKIILEGKKVAKELLKNIRNEKRNIKNTISTIVLLLQETQ